MACCLSVNDGARTIAFAFYAMVWKAFKVTEVTVMTHNKGATGCFTIGLPSI